jgi:hypothetical protein
VGRHGGTRSSGDQPPTGRHQARPGGEPNAERCNATRPSTTLERRHPGDKMAEPDRADAAVSRCDRDHARGRPRARRRPLRHLTPLDGDGRVGFSHSLPVVSSRLPACYASALRQGGISSRRQVEKRAESLLVTVGARNTLDIGAKCFGGCVGDLMNSVADLLEANHTDLSTLTILGTLRGFLRRHRPSLGFLSPAIRPTCVKGSQPGRDRKDDRDDESSYLHLDAGVDPQPVPQTLQPGG